MEKMVVDVHTNYNSCHYWRLVSITTVCALVLSSFPVNGFSVAGDGEKIAKALVEESGGLDAKDITARFDCIEASEDPYKESKDFIRAFLAEIELRYGISLTIPEACNLVRNNLHLLGIPEEAKEFLLSYIEFLENDQEIFTEQSRGLYWPWEWNWFGLNKKNKNSSENTKEKIAGQQPVHGDEFSGSVYVGGAEILAGALTCVLGLVYTPAIGLGGALMIDGIRRIADDLVEAEKTETFPANVP